jgi:RNA-directed DNA polymerase
MNKKQIFNYWKKSFESAGIKPELSEVYLNYIQPLIENEVPIIFDFKHLCLLLGRTPEYLASAINSNTEHYRTFKIPKKKSGFREITAPYPALMECQYWIYHNVLKKIKIHPAAQGFTFNKSIITNSTIHIRQKQFLKIDLKDFFPSIKINRIINVFKKLGYNHRVSFYLASLCCYTDELPQGAPTSPILSNIIAKPLDARLFAFAKKLNLKYTRYADDLAFTGENIPSIFIEYITQIIEDLNLEVNGKKTILQKQKGKRVLTGISIADNEIKIPREYKRNLKQEIHFIKTYGLSSHIRKKKIRHPNYLQSVIGKVIFWLSVEPQSEYARTSLEYLKSLRD